MASFAPHPSNRASTKSYWQHTAKPAEAPTAAIPGETDIVIVGGGLAGLSTAIAILEQSPFTRVSVLESVHVGYGASGRAGGLVSPLAAPVWLATAARNPDHAWAVSYLRRAVGDAVDFLKRAIPESEIANTTLGLESTGRLTGLGLAELSTILSSSNIPHRHSGDEVTLSAHTVNPFGLVQGLARHARALGASIFEGVNVEHINETANGAHVTLSDGHTIAANTVVICTNAYTGALRLPQKPRGRAMSNYMIATEPLPEHIQSEIAVSGRFTVELNGAYVFYRLHEGRLLFGGIEKLGRTGETDVPAAILVRLEALMRESFPNLPPLHVHHAWAGQYHMTATDLPDIRRLKRGQSGETGSIVMNTGYGGTGIALTLALANHVAALALNQDAPEPEDTRLAGIIANTGLPLASMARLAARIGWAFVKQTTGLAGGLQQAGRNRSHPVLN